MTTQTITLLPLNTYGPGNFNGSTAVQTGVKLARLKCWRDDWPETGGDLASMSLDISFDNGATWNFLASATLAGGPPKDVFSTITIPLREPENAQRRVRGTVNLGTAISTKVELDLVS